MDKLFLQLGYCTELIEQGGASGDITWLNKFCAVLHKFASNFKLYLPEIAPKADELEGSAKLHVETIFLCFTQALTCITQLERTMSLESQLEAGMQLSLSRTHFLDRINWCLRRLQASLYLLAEQATAIAGTAVKLDDLSFVELLDLALAKLQIFDEMVANDSIVSLKQRDDLYIEVNHIVRHALAFANVALQSDKKALNAICETVLQECATFEGHYDAHSPADRKLEALSLQRALYSLETYLNEALLRLIFASFLDMDMSVGRLKEVLLHGNEAVDFDVTMDRIQQIGVFAIAFTADVKTRTVVRSCLASLESLDACIVPAFQLQTCSKATHHANILEQHFWSELLIFRNVIHEIIDSRALIASYLDLLAEGIANAEQLYAQGQLLQISRMGNVLCQQFHLQINYQELSNEGQRLHQDFIVILGECEAVLALAERVDLKRIVKRLKILYSVLSKLRDAIGIRVNRETFKPGCTNLSERQRTFAKPQPHSTVAKKPENCPESDLISFQLTEILNFN
ncbi:hypothetical protein KR222_001658 [Zaprionus bogoriensis]|nr:hypothetical protein KR222_001658 [Zaprionus bogoriensis]